MIYLFCSVCGVEEETVEHVIRHCQKYETHRETFVEILNVKIAFSIKA